MSCYRSIMSYLCDLFFIFTLIIIMINNITSLKQTQLFFAISFRIPYISFWMITWMKNMNNLQRAKVQPQGVA